MQDPNGFPGFDALLQVTAVNGSVWANKVKREGYGQKEGWVKGK